MSKGNPNIDDIYVSTVRSCIGEIYPSIRLVCFGIDFDNKVYTLRIYLDRHPKGQDFEAANTISGNVFGDYWGYFSEVKEECIYSKEPFNKLDSLDEIVYARREHNMDEVT